MSSSTGFHMLSLSILLTLLQNPFLVHAQPAFVYDGVSTVEFTGQFNWTIKYPLGGICEDLNWGKILTIDITAKSTQADLIFAFGTQSEYFGVVIGYDKAIHVPFGGNTLGLPRRIGAAFVTPPSGSPLQEALISLEQQYARTIDFRDSLITTLNQTKEWEMIVDDNDGTNPFSKNGTQLVLDIRGDRRNDKTYLAIYKNGRNGSIEMSSTWGYGENVFLYMGLDGIHDELFVLSGITSDDQCSWTPRPTTAIPTMDTLEPTMTPSISPTDDTRAPSIDPTMDPTSDPSVDPTSDPTASPTMDPTADPTSDPTELPSMYPTIEPTYTATLDELDISTTNVDDHSVMTLIGDHGAGTTSTTDDDSGSVPTSDVITEDEDEDDFSVSFSDLSDFSIMEKIIVGGILLIILIILGIIVYICFKYSKRDKFGKPQLSAFEMNSNSVEMQNNHMGTHTFAASNSVNVDL